MVMIARTRLVVHILPVLFEVNDFLSGIIRYYLLLTLLREIHLAKTVRHKQNHHLQNGPQISMDVWYSIMGLCFKLQYRDNTTLSI